MFNILRMFKGTLCVLALLMVTATVPEVTSEKLHEYDYEELVKGVFDGFPYKSEAEYLRQIRSMSDAFKRETNGMVVQSDAQVDTKYRTWKRNADFINALLALPKGMNDAGRR